MKLRCCALVLLGCLGSSVALGAKLGSNPLVEPAELRGEMPRSVSVPAELLARLDDRAVVPAEVARTSNTVDLGMLGWTWLRKRHSSQPELVTVASATPMSDTDSPAPAETPLNRIGHGLANIAESVGQGVQDIKEAAMCAGIVTLSKIAPVLGFDFNRSRGRSTGLNLVADVGMAQAGRPTKISFASSNPTLNTVLDNEVSAHERAQVAASSVTSFKLEPTASLGFDYRFE